MVSGIIGAGLLSTLSLSIFRLLKLRLPRSVLSSVITSLPSFDPISPFTYFSPFPSICSFSFALSFMLLLSAWSSFPNTAGALFTCSFLKLSPHAILQKLWHSFKMLRTWSKQFHKSLNWKTFFWTVEVIVNKAWLYPVKSCKKHVRPW